MEKLISEINSRIHGIVWGPFMLLLLIGIGIYLTVRTGFFQVFRIREIFGVVFKRGEKGGQNKEKKSGAISSFQAAATSLAGCIGTGNIVGVATTLVAGGPGALFWMWVSSFFGMMTKYAEIVLAVHFKTKNERGEPVGGPMYYIEKGLKMKWLGMVFAVCGALASFGIGNMTQVNSIAESFHTFTEVNSLWIGIFVAVIVAFVIIGGIKRIAGVSAVLVPVFAVFYMVGAVVVLAANYQAIPQAFSLIISEAFSVRAIGGGIFGYVFMNAIRFGIARGVFSNEAGLGSAPLAHAAAQNDHPVKEGMWGIFEVFFDTIVMCTITGLVILTSGAMDSGLDGAALTAKAFSSFFGGHFTDIFLAVSITFFAFSTLVGWSYYGERCVDYLFKKRRAVLVYKVLFIGCIVLGATMELQLVWEISDTLNGAMAIPNLIALIGLSGIVFRLTKEYKRPIVK